MIPTDGGKPAPVLSEPLTGGGAEDGSCQSVETTNPNPDVKLDMGDFSNPSSPMPMIPHADEPHTLHFTDLSRGAPAQMIGHTGGSETITWHHQEFGTAHSPSYEPHGGIDAPELFIIGTHPDLPMIS